VQHPTAPPRDGLTVAQVETLLTDPGIVVDFGAELLDADLNVVEDISDDLEHAEVERRMLDTIHGTCRMRLARELEWGTALVQLYMTVTSRGVEARFNCGVYCPVTPERPKGSTPTVFDVEGMDRLHLLDREVGDTYEVAAGTGYVAAMRQAVTDAGLSGELFDGTADASVLPSTRVWPLVSDEEPTTWLRVVNDLAAAINYRAVWADENGRYRSDPYVLPEDRAVEWTFDATDSRNIVGEDQVVVEDLWRAPNRWVFVQSNRPDNDPPTDGDGIYVRNNVSVGPSSQDERGGLVWARRFEYEAASHDELVALGDRRVALDLRRVVTVSARTGPFPLAGHADVYRWRDSEDDFVVQAVGWRYDLAGSDVEFELEVVS
jgi:hypothetical protein